MWIASGDDVLTDTEVATGDFIAAEAFVTGGTSSSLSLLSVLLNDRSSRMLAGLHTHAHQQP